MRALVKEWLPSAGAIIWKRDCKDSDLVEVMIVGMTAADTSREEALPQHYCQNSGGA
jgi:hypothetical protein